MTLVAITPDSTHTHPTFCEVIAESENGVITLCDLVVDLVQGVEGEVTCPRCLYVKNPPSDAQAPRRTFGRKARSSSGRSGRRKNSQVVGESLNFAHKALVGAIEWYNRGTPGQFEENMLDNVNLAIRFLGEIILDSGRELPEMDVPDV